MRLIQINLQPMFGGGEVYTGFLTRALAQIGVVTTLVCHRDAEFWDRLALPDGTELRPVGGWEEALARLPEAPAWVLTHGALARPGAERVARNHMLTGIAHMPLQGGRGDRYDDYAMVFGVSNYVLAGLRAAGYRAWTEPFYGVADFQRFQAAKASAPLRQTSRYDWDLRKGRDRLLSWVEPIVEPLRHRPLFEKRAGLTLGIVSRLTPIKQFPLLFSLLAPVLARRPQVRLEIFGSGGYASVRDLDHAVAPLGDRVRYWGQQQDVATVYRQLDYLMAGLPEKEALGLNVIEAQACGTPVLAVGAPPFTETVLDGRTGYFYPDPRGDGGAGFGALIERLPALAQPLRPQDAHEHLRRFGFDAFVARMRGVVEWAGQQVAQRR